MTRKTTMLLGASLIGLLAAGGLAQAQQSGPTTAPSTAQSPYDPAQLPETHGKVAQYSLTPRGDVDGLILDDGTEVHFPPRLGTELVFVARPGDSVTIHGLKARAAPLVMAMSITNDATHRTVEGMRGEHAERGPATTVSGQVKETLHGPRGEVNGVLLQDGTIVRLPPPEAARLSAILAVGKPLVVVGEMMDTPLGKVVGARQIGADQASLTTIAPPRPGPGMGMGPMMMRMLHGAHDMHGHPGPDGAPPPPPPGGPDAPPPAQ